MKLYSKVTLRAAIACIFCMILCCGLDSWSQQIDSVRISWTTRTKRASRIPEIKANIQPYRPFFNNAIGSTFFNAYSITPKPAPQNIGAEKLLTIVKIYPNPVESQLNIVLAIAKDNTPVTIKIMDLLGNEVVTLSNEKLPAGEQTKTFSIPTRMNPGIYFLKVTAGSESQIKRISVL
ncbi:hypothetical protein ABIB40_001524 [Pedobacter sp. UYP30]|uniref:T9SS type A sorting domain-containing protein n=1 Tax=Pedobacter sp. UYP30 TaxID=1756400 RepID=UPI0033990AFF